MGGLAESAVAQAEPEVLARLFPFRELNEETLIIAAGETSLLHAAAGNRLIERGSEDDWAFYLLEGVIELEAADGKKRELKSDSDKSAYPVSTLRPHRYTVTARTPVVFVQLGRAVLDSLIADCESKHEEAYVVEVLNTEGELLRNPLFSCIHNDLAEGKLTIPSLPEVAIKIQQLVRNENVDAAKLVKVIQTDPAMAVKLIKAANSPIYRGRAEIESCADAVVRLGMRTVSSLILSFAMRDLFKAKTPELQQRMKSLWEHSTNVASIAFILAHMLPDFSPERALLAGLVHDVGEITILETLEKYPEIAPEPAQLDEAIGALRGEIGGLILEKWSFPGELVDVARQAESWYRDPAETADYCDLVQIAQLHSFVGTPRLRNVPPMYDLPAFAKMPLGKLTPELSLHICNQAQTEIEKARRWLTL